MSQALHIYYVTTQLCSKKSTIDPISLVKKMQLQKFIVYFLEEINQKS